MVRRWLYRLAATCLVLVVAFISFAAALFGPYLLDDWRLDWVVRAVALDWRDFGLERARTRLQYELDHQGIGAQVADHACAFDEEEERKSVHCKWSVKVPIPGSAGAVPLAFSSTATIAPDGELN
jgi:hypothetical protein